MLITALTYIAVSEVFVHPDVFGRQVTLISKVLYKDDDVDLHFLIRNARQ